MPFSIQVEHTNTEQKVVNWWKTRFIQLVGHLPAAYLSALPDYLLVWLNANLVHPSISLFGFVLSVVDLLNHFHICQLLFTVYVCYVSVFCMYKSPLSSSGYVLKMKLKTISAVMVVARFAHILFIHLGCIIITYQSTYIFYFYPTSWLCVLLNTFGVVHGILVSYWARALELATWLCTTPSCGSKKPNTTRGIARGSCV